ncbi:MAG: hypothetical protein QM627_10915 [Luteolibacter sp.]
MTSLKALLALMLGLAFQLSQAHTGEVPAQSQRCACCCLEKAPSQPRPAPPVTVGVTQENVAAIPAEEPDIPVANPPSPLPSVIAGGPVALSFSGYPGVRLSIVFCSYLL